MASLSPTGERATLALIADLYSQVIDLRGRLEQEREDHTAQATALEQQLQQLRDAVRAEAGIPTDT